MIAFKREVYAREATEGVIVTKNFFKEEDMKRQQLTAVLLSAVLSISICLPSACVSAWAAEDMAEEQTTEQIQETGEDELPDEEVSGEEAVFGEEISGEEETISEEAAGEEVSDEEAASIEESSDGEGIGEAVSGEHAADEEISGEEPAGEEISGEEAGGGENIVSGDTVSGEEVSGEVAGGGENIVSGDTVSGEETSGEEAGAEETVSEDAAFGEEDGGETREGFAAWLSGFDEDKYSAWQSPEPIPYGDKVVSLGETYTLNIETETNDGRNLYFQWYQGENWDELIEGATSPSLDAVMYVADGWNPFLCRVTDDYNNMIEIRCLVYAWDPGAGGGGEGGEIPSDATPIGIGNPGTATFTEEARWVTFSFTPETDGDYTFYAESDYDTHAYLKDGNGKKLVYKSDGGEGENFKFSYYLYAGTEYFLDVAEMNSEDCSCTVYVEEGKYTGGSGEDSNLRAWAVGHEEVSSDAWQNLSEWEGSENLQIGDSYRIQIMAETRDGSEPTFQWYQNHKLLQGATSPTFDAVIYQSSWNYFICKVRDTQGNLVEIFCAIYGNGDEDQNHERNLSAWIVGHEDLKDDNPQTIDDWGEGPFYIGDTVTLQAEAETQDGSTPLVQWYKGYPEEENPIEGANSLIYEALLDQEWNVYTCCIQDDYGNQVTLECCISVQTMEGNLKAWEAGHEGESGNTWQDLYDWEGVGSLHIGDTYNIQILAETQDGSEPTFQWYQNEEPIEGATAPAFEAVMFREGDNSFKCVVTDRYGNTVNINCHFNVETDMRQGAVPLTIGTPATATFSEEARWVPFIFTPETDGRYVFYAESDYDTLADLYDGNDSEIGWYNDGGEGRNFRFTARLNAGEEYLLQVSEMNSEDCSCTVHVEQFIPAIVNGMELYGDASVLEDGSVQLTPDEEYKTGSVWLPEPVDTQDGLTATFSWFSDGSGGEGMTMMFSGEKDIGDSEGNLGFVNGATGVEFDRNEDAEYSRKHIGIIRESAFNHVSFKEYEKVGDSQWHQASILYKPGYLVAFVDGEEVIHAVDITLPEQVYFGASAANSDLGGRHMVKDLAVSAGSNDFPDTDGWENEVPPTYNITFNAMGGYFYQWDDEAGDYIEAPSMTVSEYESFQYCLGHYVPGAPDGKVFSGWSLTEDGEIVDPGKVIELNRNTEYFAVWVDNCTITFEAGQYGYYEVWQWNEETEMSEYAQVPATTYEIGKGGAFVRENYLAPTPKDDSKVFVGWSLTSDGEPITEDGFTINGDITLYAVWGDPCAVTWDANGSFISIQVYDEESGEWYDELVRSNTEKLWKGAIIQFDQVKTPEDYSESTQFAGWALSPEGEPVSSGSYTITGDITFYAIWREYSQQKEITAENVTLAPDALVYNGEEQKPVVTVSLDGSNLTEGTDYSVEYSSNINAGNDTAVVKVVGKGDYTGEVIKTFSIAKADQTITASDLSLTFPNGGKITASGNKGKLTYTSSNTAVAEVDASGNVTAKGAGTAAITIKAAGTDNYNEAAKEITVTIAKASQTITASDLSLTFPKSGKITVSGNEGELTYTSSKTSVAEVDASGNVTAKGAGTATITIKAAETANYNAASKQVTVTIAKAKQTITASNLSMTFPKSGKITVSGNKGKLTYTSSKTSVVTVDASGNVKAKGAGTATITIKAAATSNYNAASKQITVTVAKAAQSITTKAKASSVAVGKTVAVTTTGAQGKVTYKTSDTAIATVNASTGVVTARKVGTVKITATAAATSNYKAASKTVTIKVVPAATKSLKAENLAKGIKVTWAKVTGANGYYIYRNSSKVKTITSGATVKWTDTAANNNGTKYVYKVVAKAATGASTLSKSLTTYKVTAPAITSALNSVTKKAAVSWGKNAKATGYEIQYSLSSSFSSPKKVTITSNATVKTTLSSLTVGKTYYIRIRAYKTVSSTKYYSNWSAAKTVKISK